MRGLPVKEFVVYLEQGSGRSPTRWSFVAFNSAIFPEEFQAFDFGLSFNSTVVWVTDTTQALVAYDWLVERGWEYWPWSNNTDFTKLLARCGVCLDIS